MAPALAPCLAKTAAATAAAVILDESAAVLPAAPLPAKPKAQIAGDWCCPGAGVGAGAGAPGVGALLGKLAGKLMRAKRSREGLLNGDISCRCLLSCEASSLLKGEFSGKWLLLGEADGRFSRQVPWGTYCASSSTAQG